MASLVALNYGEALFELAKEENCLAPIKKELTEIRKTLNECTELTEVMCHPKIEKDEKKNLMKKVFPTEKILENFLCLLIDRNRFEALGEIVQVFIENANRALGIEVAYVTSATPLSEKEKTQLQTVLSKKVQREVELECKVDATCLAGVRVQILDEVLDNTIAGKLENIKQSVASAALTN